MPHQSHKTDLSLKDPQVSSESEENKKSAYKKNPQYVSKDKNKLKEISKKYRRKKNG